MLTWTNLRKRQEEEAKLATSYEGPQENEVKKSAPARKNAAKSNK
jgi:ribosomal protein S21